MWVAWNVLDALLRQLVEVRIDLQRHSVAEALYFLHLRESESAEQQNDPG